MTPVTFRSCLLMLVCALPAVAAHAQDRLYDRLGGEAGVAAIAAALIDRAVADPLMGPTFVDTKLPRIKTLLAEQICDLSGGPCHYSGDSMQEVHAGHHISDGMFNRLVEALRDVLNERHIDERSKNQLLRLLAPMKRDVVQHAEVTHQTGTPTNDEAEKVSVAAP